MAYGDEITDQIMGGKKLYEQGKYSEAVSELRFAIGQIQGLQADQLKKVLPEPLAGWKAEEATGESAAMGFLGGGLAVSRHYYVEDSDKSVSIEVVTESPLLQSVMMFLSSPLFMAQDKKLIKINDHKAVMEFSAEDREGKIELVVGTKTLVTVSGDGIDSKDILVEYAKKVEFSKVKTVVGE